jgi:iron complex transport system substrate-binding protein
VEAVAKRVEGQPQPKVLFVVWYRPLITAGSKTFIADVIRRAGGASIINDMTGEWPHMGLEVVLKRDPDVILFPKTEAFAPGFDEFQQLPGWKELAAVRSHRMYFIAETIMRPSPRLIDALEELTDILHPQTMLHPRLP